MTLGKWLINTNFTFYNNNEDKNINNTWKNKLIVQFNKIMNKMAWQILAELNVKTIALQVAQWGGACTRRVTGSFTAKGTYPGFKFHPASISLLLCFEILFHPFKKVIW